jgi:hypothetical protein
MHVMERTIPIPFGRDPCSFPLVVVCSIPSPRLASGIQAQQGGAVLAASTTQR